MTAFPQKSLGYNSAYDPQLVVMATNNRDGWGVVVRKVIEIMVMEVVLE